METIKYHAVKESPFTIVEVLEDQDQIKKGCYIVIGDKYVTQKKFETVVSAIKWLKSKPWEAISAIIFATMEMYYKIKKEDKL